MELTELLGLTVKYKASDLHLSPDSSPVLRIDGELKKLEDLPRLSSDEIRKLLLPSMSKMQQDLFEKDLQLDCSVSIPNLANFRVNLYHQSLGVAAAIRYIPETPPTLEDLQMPPVFKRLLGLSRGLILVTGHTGSGKSTTLAAMVNHINSEQALHIITIEDPIEFVHHSKKSLISQRQVYRDTRSFNDALRAALREDPDVILVGEMRDLETVRLALTAAETGHLVMATLHTSTAPRTVNRIVDVFPEGEKNLIRNMFSESLQAVICQNLVQKIGGGRTAVFEIMLGTTAIRNLIREGKIGSMVSTIQTGSQFGMCTFEQYLQQLVKNNVVSLEAAQQIATDRDLFAHEITGGSHQGTSK